MFETVAQLVAGKNKITLDVPPGLVREITFDLIPPDAQIDASVTLLFHGAWNLLPAANSYVLVPGRVILEGVATVFRSGVATTLWFQTRKKRTVRLRFYFDEEKSDQADDSGENHAR